jgi:hypothetical protein
VATRAANFFNFCSDVFGQTLDPAAPNLQRDFPILEAYDNRLLIGRFGYESMAVARTPGATGSEGWSVVGRDPSNADFLSALQCCFHNQIHFNVRTGGQWSASGSVSGFLHHIIPTAPDQRCAPSCDQREALLNGRAAPVPSPAGDPNNQCEGNVVPVITRDSVLAMRNPMFSFLIWNGQVAPVVLPDGGVVDAGESDAGVPFCSDSPPVRDMEWIFSTRGQYTPLSLNLSGSTAGLSPQSMRFIDSLGQLAVIDGASQGLILINLNTITEAHAPYF